MKFRRRKGLSFNARRQFVLGAFGLLACLLVTRGLYLQLSDRTFLQDQGLARCLRTDRIMAHRGMILDRNDEPLAISTPMSSLWTVPVELAAVPDTQIAQLARALRVSREKLRAKLAPLRSTGKPRKFAYLKRHVTPDVAEQVTKLGLPGVYVRREYRRFYPASEVAAHVVGFTDIEDRGQEGVELMFDRSLRGVHGVKRVIKDRLGRFVEDVESVQAVQPGEDIRLSIDKRLQYVVFRELKEGVLKHKAKSGSAVLLNARTGEVLAMVNEPDFNPNDRKRAKSDHLRNRAITDAFEPGSTMKPFVVAAALEAGTVRPSTPIDTRPGTYTVGRHSVRDDENMGMLDVTGVISRSSNVGISKIALGMPPATMWNMLNNVGFGNFSATNLPGASAGRLPEFESWKDFQQATISFGYGISVSALQLARAYTVFVNDGKLISPTLVRIDNAPSGTQAMSARTAHQVRAMLEEVVMTGTGRLAGIPNYRIAGKTGTAHKAVNGSYAEHDYRSLFVGMLSASRTPLVAAVIIDDPNNGAYFGGDVAAPVFANIMREAVRLLDIPPDDSYQPPRNQNNIVNGHARVFAEKTAQ